jgi:4-hydroxy-tetrahydrodipicolinate synthase
MNKLNKLKGVFSPVLTPFNGDYTVDPDRFIKHCKWLINQDVGLAIFGTNSEATSLSVDEKISLLDELIGSGLSPERMMPGGGSCSLPDTVRMTKHVVSVGCAGVLMLPPFY